MTDGRKHAKKDDDVLPAMYEHCCRTYSMMLSESTKVGHVVVYEGYLTRLITQKVMLSVPYYGKIRTLLLEMGCVRQLKRGGGNSPSQWELITEPTEELFRKAHANNEAPQGETKIGKLSNRVTEAEQALSRALDRLDSIEQFLAEQFGTEEV